MHRCLRHQKRIEVSVALLRLRSKTAALRRCGETCRYIKLRWRLIWRIFNSSGVEVDLLRRLVSKFAYWYSLLDRLIQLLLLPIRIRWALKTSGQWYSLFIHYVLRGSTIERSDLCCVRHSDVLISVQDWLQTLTDWATLLLLLLRLDLFWARVA